MAGSESSRDVQSVDDALPARERRGKVVILDGFTPDQLREVLTTYRRSNHLPQDVAFAVVTPESSRRVLSDVLSDIRADAAARRTPSPDGGASG
ncbi:DUF3783 domain-containing protein [Candidatus Poribacteria bacterium]|nr:DUF3783 domain-containing protein [Candidatus Poribacteria bacterium]